MGFGAALAPPALFERVNATLRADVHPLEVAGIDLRHTRRPAAIARRIKIGVEHAGRPHELKLRADALDDLQARLSKMFDQLAGGHSVERAMIVIVASRGRRCCGRHGLRSGGRGTSRRKQGGEWEQAAHVLLVAGGRDGGKLVPAAIDR